MVTIVCNIFNIIIVLLSMFSMANNLIAMKRNNEYSQEYPNKRVCLQCDIIEQPKLSLFEGGFFLETDRDFPNAPACSIANFIKDNDDIICLSIDSEKDVAEMFGWCTCCKGIDAQFAEIAHALTHHKTIKTLILSNAGQEIPDSAIFSIINSARTMDSLETILINGEKCQEKTFLALVDLINTTKRIKRMTIGFFLGDSTNNWILLGKAIAQNRTLEFFECPYIYFEELYWKIFADHLIENRGLTHVSLGEVDFPSRDEYLNELIEDKNASTDELELYYVGNRINNAMHRNKAWFLGRFFVVPAYVNNSGGEIIRSTPRELMLLIIVSLKELYAHEGENKTK